MSDAETARRNGWTVGTRLAGDRHAIASGHTDIHIIPDTTPPPVRVSQGWAEWITKGKP